MSVHSPRAHPDAGDRTAAGGVIAGLVDTIVTVGAMIAANSSVLIADSLKTLLEFVAVLLSWLALRTVRRGQARHFDYGLDKLENLSSLFVAVLMLLCLAIIVVNATIGIMRPSRIEGVGVWVSLASQTVYAGINGALFRRNRRLALRENSPVMASQAKLFLTKTIANGFIFISLASSLLLHDRAWAVYIDPIAALAIAASILMPAVGTFSNSFYDLMDRTLEETDKLTILRELGPFVFEFTDLHGIRSRRAGRIIFIEILLEFDPDRKVGEVQDVAERLRDSIQKAIPSSRVTIGLARAPVEETAAPPPTDAG
jgi:ferrous-iron efflux pump FieF